MSFLLATIGVLLCIYFYFLFNFSLSQRIRLWGIFFSVVGITLLIFIAFLLTESRTVYYFNTEPQTAEVTYYSEYDSCHYENCVMASGKRAYVGAIACPRHLELGTKVNIDGEIYTCEDRYSKWLSYRFDIFTGYGEEAYREALNNGISRKVVSIL